MSDFERFLQSFLPPSGLAPEFQADFYRAKHADLAAMQEPELVQHYESHGRGEGRAASPAAHRSAFVAQVPRDGLVLEIGPAVRPALAGPHVRYFEIAGRDELLSRAIAEGYAIDRCPEAIHYVSPTADLSIVPDKFDAVFSSHCVEHQPDLVRHLELVADLLKDGGHYFMMIPDKRYCFDALLPESGFDEIEAAHRERRAVHTHAKVIEHWVMTTHDDVRRHWRGDRGDPREAERESRQRAAETLFAEAAGGYVDVHAWQFTPASFRTIIAEIRLRCATGLVAERVYDTIFETHEFGAVLRKAG